MSTLFRSKDNKHSRKVFQRIAVILQLFFTTAAAAQYDSLLHKPYSKNVLGIHAMYKDLIDINDSVLRAQKAESIKSFARKHNDRTLALNVDFFLNFWNTFYQNQPKEISLRKLTAQLDFATKNNVDFLRARSLRALAEFYWKIEKNYELAFEQYLLLDKELTRIVPDDYPEMARDLMQIGEAYYFFQDFSIAKQYFKKAIALEENAFNTMVINAARNNLGLCSQHENQLDSADYYFKAVLNTTFPEAKPWKRVVTGNLGGNMYLRKQYDKAIPLLEMDFQGAVAEHDNGSAAGAAITLASIFLEQGSLKQAGIFIDNAREYIAQSAQIDRMRLLYPIIAKWYADMGAIEKSKTYVDSSIWALNKYNEKFSALKVLRAQQKVNRQQEQLQQVELNLERSKKAAERNFLILLVILLLIIALLTYFIQKKRQLEKDLKLQKAAQELEAATISLNKFAERIQEKKRLIEELEQKLDKNINIDNNLILRLQESTILTEDDWLNFKSLFEQVHAGFLHRLKEKHPTLSPAEVRFVSLAKLNFTSKEMAAALGVSPQSIRTNWYRIRKKLDLSDEITTSVFVSEI